MTKQEAKFPSIAKTSLWGSSAHGGELHVHSRCAKSRVDLLAAGPAPATTCCPDTCAHRSRDAIPCAVALTSSVGVPKNTKEVDGPLSVKRRRRGCCRQYTSRAPGALLWRRCFLVGFAAPAPSRRGSSPSPPPGRVCRSRSSHSSPRRSPLGACLRCGAFVTSNASDTRVLRPYEPATVARSGRRCHK